MIQFRQTYSRRGIHRGPVRALAALTCMVLVMAGSPIGYAFAAEGEGGAASPESMIILTATRVPIPKSGDFTEVTLADAAGMEMTFSGIPGEWFENAEFVDYAAPNEDGSIHGVQIDMEANQVLMIEGGDRINLLFIVDGVECEFSFGPGTQLAVQKIETGFALIPAKTIELSPPQKEPVE